MNDFSVLQVILGFLGVLFVPGLLMTYVFFPMNKKDSTAEIIGKTGASLNWLERVLLSFAFSVSVVPLILFFLNKIGIKITQINIAIVLGILIILEIVFLIFRKIRTKQNQKE
ncbi:MAG: DUF1616 domain-containing protein [Patescibacteria group bacterium]|jgi:uncharacterized membrane protein